MFETTFNFLDTHRWLAYTFSYVVTVGPKVVTAIFLIGTTNPQQFSNRAVLIDRYLCMPLRTDGIKAMSRGFSGCRQVKKIAGGRNRG